MNERQTEIFEKTRELMVEMFEIDAEKITPSAHLYDELDIDSIDAVDLVLELRDQTGAKIEQEDFREVRTIEDVVITVDKILGQNEKA